MIVSALSTPLITIANAPAAEPPGTLVNNDGSTVLIIGHSLTHCLRALEPLAPMVRHSAHKQELYTILGAGIAYHYQMETNPWTPVSWRKLYFSPGKKWDALIMSARDAHWKGPKEISSDEEYAPKFAAEAFKGNPQCQVFIYGNWPSVTDDFDKPSFAYTDEYIERVGAAVNKAFPNAPKARIMPCMRMVRELARLADRGELPGVASRFALFTDDVHPGRFTAYALNVLVMAMLYNESPLAYPSDVHEMDSQGKPVRGDVFKDLRVPEATASAIKRVVWDILQTYPPAGMPSSLVIADRHLEPVIAGQPYKAELKAIHAAGSCTWAITQGTLPQGLSFSAQGVLAGQSTAVGNYPLTIKLIGGKSSFERPLVVSISQGTPPLIPNQSLGTVPLDQYIIQPLEIVGGVGHITWSISGGKLPYGIRLSPTGMLVGSPGEQGEFAFTIKAEDSFPNGPRSTEKALTWTIGPAAPTTLKVKSIVVMDKDDDKTVVIDGKLDERFWKLDQTIAKKVKGTPTKQASFGAIWTHVPRADLQQRRRLVLAIKVLDGPKGRTPKDGIHIFIDGNHNRSVIYSGDDTHFFIPRNHKGGWAQSLRGKVNWFTDARVQEIEGGYTMEVSLQDGYFKGEGNWLPFGAKGVYGFEMAVDEGDDKQISQQVWRGGANDSEDTSHFGTIVLVSEPAANEKP
jgi:hypothetical protein